MDNLRTLCTPCHAKTTAAQAAWRASERRARAASDVADSDEEDAYPRAQPPLSADDDDAQAAKLDVPEVIRD